jgi:PAS domain-containing protein
LDNDALLVAIQQWRERGHLIVLDDYGAGYAAANTVLTLQPDIVKLDISLVRDIDQDMRRQAIVASIRDYTHDLGIRLVAEGIETRAECDVLCQMGVDYGQGYWLRRPELELFSVLLNIPPGRPAYNPSPATPPSTARTLQFYAEAIRQADIPTYLVDRRRTILAWNAAAVQAVGHVDHYMVNQSCFGGPLQHQDPAGRALCVGSCPLVHSMVSKNLVGPSEITLVTADGNRVGAKALVFPLWDPTQQRVIGAVEQFWLSAKTESSVTPVLAAQNLGRRGRD